MYRRHNLPKTKTIWFLNCFCYIITDPPTASVY